MEIYWVLSTILILARLSVGVFFWKEDGIEQFLIALQPRVFSITPYLHALHMLKQIWKRRAYK